MSRLLFFEAWGSRLAAWTAIPMPFSIPNARGLKPADKSSGYS